MVNLKSSTLIREASSRASTLPGYWSSTILRSAWTARELGAITSLSSGFGVRWNTKKCISGLLTALPKRAYLWAAISISTTASVPILAASLRWGYALRACHCKNGKYNGKRQTFHLS